LDDYGLAGLAVGIVEDNAVVYAKGFGFENVQTGTPVTPSTVFHTASISKTFVATAVMQLAEAGDIDLDQHLVEVLPYFVMADPRYAQITIEQMLTHTAGLPDIEDYHWEDPEYDDEALGRYVRSLATEGMIADPGTTWAYSNLAYEVLGEVVADTSGMLFEQYQERHVLEPAGMLHSTFLKGEELPPGWACPHLMSLTPRPWSHYPYHRAHAPSSTLHSSVLDLCQWAILNLNHGTFGEHSILSSSTYGTLWRQFVEFPPDRGLFHNGGGQGIAWALAEYKGYEVIGHSGSDVGFTSNLILVPARSLAVVVLCNSTNFVMQQITEMLLDSAIGYAPQLPVPPAAITVCRTLEKEGVEAAVTQWTRLQSDYSNEFDFGPEYFLLIAGEIFDQGTDEEAALMACLFIRVMSEDEVAHALDVLLAALQDDPENPRGAIMMSILRDGLGCPPI